MISIDKFSELSVNDFYLKFLSRNEPCIFNENFTSNWRCRKNWIDKSEINFKLLFEYNKSTDSMYIADCKQFYFDSHLKVDMSVNDFLSYWNNFHQNKDDRILYLKDWHYFLKTPNATCNFVLLKHFSSDWLNEFSDIRKDIIDDYRFVYVGVKGSCTGIHVDVMRSYSWSANICGKKRWILFPPGSENAITKKSNKMIDLSDIANIPHLEIIQEEGEIIFVPSGWWHQVENMTDCISVNHNWINGFNVCESWRHLCQQLKEVESETADVQNTPGYIEQCQICLKAYSGMNFEEFIVMVEHIVYKRLKKIFNENDIHLSEITDSETENISSMKNFFERVICSKMINIESLIESNHSNIELELVDIDYAFRVLKLIAVNSTSIILGLISGEFQDFLERYSEYFQMKNKFNFL